MASSVASTSRSVLGAQARHGAGCVGGMCKRLARMGSVPQQQQRGVATSAVQWQGAASVGTQVDQARPHDVTASAQRAAEAAAAQAKTSQADTSSFSSASSSTDAYESEQRRMHMRRATLDALGKVGSTQTKASAYRPYKGRMDPVTARELTISHLMAATAHLGHNKASLQRASGAFVYGVRHGQVIIDVERCTLPALKLAARVVSKVVYNDGVVVFLGTRPHMQDFVLAAAKRLGDNGYHVTKDKWQPGTLTNSPKLLSRAVLADMDSYERQVSEKGDERQGRYDVDAAKLASQTLQPDLLIVLNPRENVHAIREATQRGIPTIGIIDSDVDPRLVTYAIPANDDALTAVELIAGVLSKAGQAAVQQRKRDEDEADRRARSAKNNRRRDYTEDAPSQGTSSQESASEETLMEDEERMQ